MRTDALQKFSLGMFSIAGSRPFAGMMMSDKVLALHAINQHANESDSKLIGCDTIRDLLADWPHNFPILNEAAVAIAGSASDLNPLGTELMALMVEVAELQIHAPLQDPGQILMARANYRRHIVELSLRMGRGAGETEAERRADLEALVERKATEGDPFFWVKTSSAITGPYDTVQIPEATQKADWEVELALVIGRPARNVSVEQALDYVAGYCIANDLSARDLLVRDEFGPAQDWLTAKCAPQFLPLGPYIVPAAYVGDPNKLSLSLKHNGKLMQDSCTDDMIHNVQTLVAYASRVVQLSPGDIISTGSPAGNGMEFDVYLRSGDVVEATVEGLGVQINRFS
ncbi:MAG: fumarylacetoacetate hydrolase family protein [Porticoccaceae bacterium]|jgi:2-keto-4-pentenoate hydratase/2-oxohepta-3-ene-1,7-dioic acid hydratase in catechol pathway|nr:fumarylacetoacetate hydrolase family protein [Porticoccaceae bacterium]